MKFYKILNEEEKHYGMQYKDGLNTDVLTFNPSGSCEPGGIYFTDAEHVFEFCSYGPWVREVTLPDGEEIYKDPGGNKYKAHRVILGKRRRWATKTMLDKLIKEGADVHAYDDQALRLAAENGHTETVELLLDRGADVHAYDDQALRCAALNGHTDTVAMLLDRGADVHAYDDLALLWAAGNGHADTVALLLDRGADVHADDNYALRWAAGNGHTDTVELLEKWMEK